MNGEADEWNRWRGAQEKVLELAVVELSEINERLMSLEEEFWVLKGKIAAYGGIAGIVASIVIAILQRT